MLVGNIRKLQENTATLYIERKTLRVSTIRGSGHVWPDRIPGARYPEKVECRRVQIVGTPPPDDTERALLSGATPSRFLKRTYGGAPLSGLLQGEAHSTREYHTRTIAYPIRICCPDHCLKWASLATSFRQPATAHVSPPFDGVSGRPVRTSFAGKTKPELNLGWKRASLPWIPKNSPQSRIALVIKKLSKHQNLTQFD